MTSDLIAALVFLAVIAICALLAWLGDRRTPPATTMPAEIDVDAAYQDFLKGRSL